MKKSSLLTGAALLAGLLTLSSCGKKDDNTLYLFNWTYYTPDSVLQDFEKEYNCKVKVDTFCLVCLNVILPTKSEKS